MRVRFLLPVLLLLFISGCATQAPIPDVARHIGDWKSQSAQTKSLDTWTIAGKVGVRTPHDSRSANLDWIQQPTQYRMMISGPFGVGRNTLEGTINNVTLANGDGTFTADTPEQLMEEQLGWSLPISSLDYWVRGIADPSEYSEFTYDNEGFPAELRQAGWTIRYLDWSYADGLWLPRRLKMNYGDLTATLVVNEWHPHQASS
ncbi:lipoprotein insertase outer membrane protein LolB [Phytohalomonas tamaricis]|uniref:lipoprotein insertase outer membrane protein LolB n=1 Tax=Phytohalomonas tamaricis TaxID=2081032 RepID=UPI000D0ADD7E|nr:lipoprotein insertase outer membrane protein LolB [Phytohalomonas tamaricis]